MGVSVGSIGFDLRGYTDKVLADTKKGLRSVQKVMRDYENKFNRMGRQMSFAVTAPITLLGGKAFQTFAKFEQQMAKVKAVSGATGDTFKALEKNALALGAKTRFAAGEVANLQLEYSKLGFSPAEIVQVTEATLALAQATDSELARSAEVAGGVLRGFQIDAKETARVTDVMAKSFSSSALDLEKYAESMKFVAPNAQKAGVSLERTSAMLSILADNMISGSQAGTGLRRIFNEIAKKGLPVQEGLRQLAKEGLNLASAEDAVGRNAQTALLILTDNLDKIDQLTKAYENAQGSAKKMADIMDQTASGALARLKSAWESVQISIGGIIAKALVPAIEKITELASAFHNLDPASQQLIVIMAGVAASIGPVLLGMAALAKMVGFVAGLFAGGGLLAAIPVITGLVVITGAAKVAMESYSGSIGDTNNKMQNLGNIGAKVLQFLSNATDLAAIGIKALGVGVLKAVEYFGRFMQAIQALPRIWKFAVGTITVYLETKFNEIMATMETMANNFIRMVTSTITKAMNAVIKNVMSGLNKILAGLQKIPGADKLGLPSSVGFKLNEPLFANPINLPKVKVGVVPTLDAEGGKEAYWRSFSDGMAGEADRVAGEVAEAWNRGASDHIIKGWESMKEKASNIMSEVKTKTTDAATSVADAVGQSAGAASQAAQKAAEAAGRAAQAAKQKAKETADAWKRHSDSFAGRLVDQLGRGELSFKSLGDTALSVIRDIAAEFLKKQIAQFFTGASGGLFSGGGILGGIGKFFGGFFADGGNPPMGKLSMVGEQGPEFIMPRRPSTVVPMDKMLGSLQGNGQPQVHVTQNFQSGITRAELAGMLDQAEKRGASKALEMMQTGGGYRDSFLAAT